MKTLKELGISPTPWVSCLTSHGGYMPGWCEIVDAHCDAIVQTQLDMDMSKAKAMEINHNADLIAAAPDLYEVVRALVDDFAKAGEMDLCILIGKAEAALKKAGGAE